MALPCVRTMIRLTASKTNRMGANHHFFRTLRNSKIKAKFEGTDINSAPLEGLVRSAAGSVRIYSNPIRGRIAVQVQPKDVLI